MTRAPWLAALGVLAACGGAAPRPAATVAPVPAAPGAPAAPTSAASAPEWLAPVELQGPYRDVAALCAARNADDGAAQACDVQGDAHRVPGAAAQLELIATGGDAEAADCVLAVHVAAGWFASGPLGSCGGIKQGGDVSIEGVTDPRLGPGARHAVVVALHAMTRNENQTDDGKTYDLTSEQSGFVACSVTATPRCTPFVVTRDEQHGDLRDTDGQAFPPATWTFDARWPGDGTLVLTAAKATTSDSPDVSAPATQAGTYRVELP